MLFVAHPVAGHLIRPWPLKALGLIVCEKETFITNVCPHSTFEQ